MSQAIQYNSSVAMTRHPHLLQRAAALTPALRQRQAPQAIVEAVADPAALNGWDTPSARLSSFISSRFASATASSLILAAILLATCSSAAAASAARRMPRPICTSPSAKR
jgi:hypothetical protein